MKKKIALEIICFLFILLFTYAAVTKLIDYQKFTVQIGQSPLLTDFAGVLAWAVPGVELLIAGMLAITRLRLVGLYAAFSLMVIQQGHTMLLWRCVGKHGMDRAFSL